MSNRHTQLSLFVLLVTVAASTMLGIKPGYAQPTPAEPYWGFWIQSPQEAVKELKENGVEAVRIVSKPWPVNGVQPVGGTAVPHVRCQIISFGPATRRTFIVYAEIKEDTLRAFSYSRMRYERILTKDFASDRFFVLTPDKSVDEIYSSQEGWIKDTQRIAWGGCNRYLEAAATEFGIAAAFGR